MDLSSQRQYLQKADNAKVYLTTTNATTLYTSPTGTAFDFTIVESILVNNNTSGQTNIILTLTDTSSNVFSLYNEHVIAADTTAELLSKSLVVKAGEILKVTAADANKLYVTASLVEYAKGD